MRDHQKRPRSKAIDVSELLRRHVEYSEKRDGWARRAIDLLAEGKDESGMDAAERAEYWALMARSLEPSM
jgi:hypothetical protein